MPDFPAAHSMDTEWFATDADGNVAVFWSSEEGAVPKSNSFGEISDFLDELPKDEQGLVRLSIDGETVIKGANLKRLQKEINRSIKSGFEILDEWLFILETEDAIAKFLSNVDDVIVFRFAGEKIVVYVELTYISEVQNLIESGEILGGKPFDFVENYHLFGLFYYRHEDFIPGRYKRRQKPENPLTIKDLPDSLREAISLTHFDRLRFEDTKIVQPIEHMKCDIWGGEGSWVDSQGKEHENYDSRL